MRFVECNVSLSGSVNIGKVWFDYNCALKNESKVGHSF